MFGLGRKKKNKSNKAEVKFAEKLLRKDFTRRVFGFLCSPYIKAKTKMLAEGLNVPLFSLIEHEVEIGNCLVEEMIEDPEERELLLRHLKEHHIDVRTIEKITQLDQEMGLRLDADRIRRVTEDRIAREIVVNYIRRGVRPEYLPRLIDLGLKWLSFTRDFPKPSNMPPKA